jgi:hypothetical protein
VIQPNKGFSKKFLVVFGVDESPEKASPLPGKPIPAKLREMGQELWPGQDGQTCRFLEDGDERAIMVACEDGNCTVVRIPAEPSGSRQGLTNGRDRVIRLAAEALDEAADGVMSQADRTIVALAGRGHCNDLSTRVGRKTSGK